jgi:adenylylsulfate kinase
MIIILTGQPHSGKTTIAKHLKTAIEISYPYRCVYNIDGDDLRELTLNKDYTEQGRIQNIKNAQLLAYFLQANKCDVVVSLVAPYKELREEFKKICADSIIEIYVHTNRKRQREQFKVEGYEVPETNFFDMDTTSDNPTQSFTKLIHYLRETDKL